MERLIKYCIKRRNQQRLTLEQVARLGGTTAATISRWENYKQINPQFETLKQILDGYQIPYKIPTNDNDVAFIKLYFQLKRKFRRKTINYLIQLVSKEQNSVSDVQEE